MTKLNVEVGDEFPINESDAAPHGRHGRWHHRHHHGLHRHGFRHHHIHGHHRGPGRLPMLLIVAGLVALAVQHQLTVTMAYGLIGAGAALLILTVLLRAVFHWRFHRRIAQQVS